MEQCLIFCRTNLDCDLLEQFLVKIGGGRWVRTETMLTQSKPGYYLQR